MEAVKSEELDEVRKKKQKQSSLWDEFDKDGLDHPIVMKKRIRTMPRYFSSSTF